VRDEAVKAFLCACELDVRVRKPGNVSLASPGHGMQAAMFIESGCGQGVVHAGRPGRCSD
jgi:triphosphoribosyl-dephospho-CoA synthase